jgi:DedD protein
MASKQDVEINLGTGKLLALFFGLVVLCAIFFALGYSLGKNSSPTMAAAEQPPVPASNGPSKPHGPASAPALTPAASSSNELTFYKAVQQSEPTPTLAPPAPTDNPARKPAPEPAARPASGYTVQIAAVSRQEDAQALVGALRKKNYPVFIASNSPGDKLFHVQVGPFTQISQAEAMRSRLSNDGYNPILKK